MTWSCLPQIPPFPQLAYLYSGQEPAQLEARPCREKFTRFLGGKCDWKRDSGRDCSPSCQPLLRENWGERRGSQDQGFFGFELMSFSFWLLRPGWRRTSTFDLRFTSVREQNIIGLSKILNSLQNTFLPCCRSLIESFTSLQLGTIKNARSNQTPWQHAWTTDRNSRTPGRAPAPWRATAVLMEPLHRRCQSLERLLKEFFNKRCNLSLFRNTQPCQVL